MSARPTLVYWQAAILAGLVCAVAVGLLRGAALAVGSLMAGALIGGWANVYARCMCALRPVAVTSLERAMLAGALVAPPLVLLQGLVGPAVWFIVAIGGLAWAAAITDDGHVHPPALVNDRLHVPRTGPHT